MSEVTFSCPHCNKQLSASDDMEGTAISCPSCQNILTIPIRIVIPEDPPQHVSVSSQGDKSCPYCRMPMSRTDAITVCSSCRTPHHAECWSENKGCTVFGCSQAPQDEEKISVAPQPRTQTRRYSRATSRPVAPAHKKVPSYLTQSILVTIFCCLPLGIAAIVSSAQVNSKLSAGDYEGAMEASQKAKKWGWVAFFLGLAAGVIQVLVAAADA